MIFPELHSSVVHFEQCFVLIEESVSFGLKNFANFLIFSQPSAVGAAYRKIIVFVSRIVLEK